MSAVGNSPLRSTEEFTLLDYDPQNYLNQSLNKIQGLLTSILHLPEGKLPSYTNISLADASLSLSDSPIMKPVKPWRYGSLTDYAYKYNDDYFEQSLDTMILGVAIELKKVRDLCDRSSADLISAIDNKEFCFPFPETFNYEPKGFFNFIASLHNNKDFINRKLVVDGLTKTNWTVLSSEEGKKRSAKYWKIVDIVNREITLILTKDAGSSSSSSSSSSYPITPKKTDLEDLIQDLSISSATSRNPHRDNSKFISDQLHRLSIKATGKLTKELSPDEWKNAKTVSTSKKWDLDMPELTEDIKDHIQREIIKDLGRNSYDIDGEDFSRSAARIDEMLNRIKTSIFGDGDDPHNVAYRIGFLMTQATFTIPLEALYNATNHVFGKLFTQDTNARQHYEFKYDPKTQTASISAEQTVLCFNTENPSQGDHMNRLVMTINLQLKIEDGNINWDKAIGSNSFVRLKK